MFFQHQADPEACRLAAVKPRALDSFISHWNKLIADRGAIARAILADERLAGNIVCFQIAGVHYVGYWLGREHWGRGIASGALRVFLDEVAIRPLHARVARHNVASIRVLEKCGFVITGYERSPETDRYLACEEALLRLE